MEFLRHNIREHRRKKYEMVKNAVMCIQALFRARRLRRIKREEAQRVVRQKALRALRMIQVWTKGKLAILQAKHVLQDLKVKRKSRNTCYYFLYNYYHAFDCYC